MRMYPAYRLCDVLDEYAVIFFSLLNEGNRQRMEDYQMLATIGDLPAMKKEDRKKVYDQLKWAAMHPSDILSAGDGSDDADIKKLLG